MARCVWLVLAVALNVLALNSRSLSDEPKPRGSELPKGDATELAKLEALIAEKEMELSNLRNKAKALKERLDKSKPAATIQKLIDGIPKGSLPVAGPEGEIERNRANKWLKENAAGKQVEVVTELSEVFIEPKGDGYDLILGFGEVSTAPVVNVPVMCFLPKTKIGDHEWFTLLSPVQERGAKEERAKALRDLKGKKVRVQAKLAGMAFAHMILPLSGIEQHSVLSLGLEELKVEAADNAKR